MLVHTKYLKATDTKGERISVRTSDGYKAVFGWDYSLDQLGNHEAAAAAISEPYKVKLADANAHGFLFHAASEEDGHS